MYIETEWDVVTGYKVVVSCAHSSPGHYFVYNNNAAHEPAGRRSISRLVCSYA